MALTLTAPDDCDTDVAPLIPDAEAGQDAAELAADMLDMAELSEAVDESEATDEQDDLKHEPSDPPFDVNTPIGGTSEDPANPQPLIPTPPFVPAPKPPEPELTSDPDKLEMQTSQRRYLIAGMEQDYIEVALEMAETETLIEHHKDRLKTLQKEFAKLSAELVQARTKAEFQPRLRMGGNEKPEPAAPFAMAGETPPAGVLPDSDAWRAGKIYNLGLTEKLADKLESHAGGDTIGHLEDYRVRIANGTDKWPPRVGPEAVTKIENAVLEYLAKHQPQPAVEQVAGTQPAEMQVVTSLPAESQDTPPAVAAESAPADEPAKPKKERKPRVKKEKAATTTAAAGDASPHKSNGHDTATSQAVAEWEAMSEADQQAFIEARAAAVGAGPAKETDHRSWHSGFEAYSRGLNLVECMYVPGADQDDWLRGFQSSQVAHTGNATTPPPATPTSPAIELEEI